MPQTGARQTSQHPERRRRWSISRKLTTASLLMIVLTVVAGGVGLWQVVSIGQAIDKALVQHRQLANSLELLAAGNRLVASLNNMILLEDPLLASTDVIESLGTLGFYMETLQAAPGSGSEETLAEMQTAYTDLRQAVSQVDLLARQENWEEASRVLEEQVQPANEKMGLLIRRVVYQAQANVRVTAAQVRAIIQQAVVVLLVLVAVTTAIALGWRQFVFRGLSQSVVDLREGVARISGGDLAHRLEVHTGDEVEELADEFNAMAAKLADLIGGLEQRVAERTRDLERRSVQLAAAAEVAREAAALRNVDRLLDRVVHLISDRFGFYHTGIFLLDDAGEYAVLRAASSEGGKRMLARGHRLRVGERGVVGYAAGQGTPRIALDVGTDAYYFDNPDLPLTRSEVALPLKVRGQVIGVLDVQSQEEAAFDEESVATLQTLADQVALAIESAHLLAESQQALQELERLYGRRLREAWQEQIAGLKAYRYTGVDVEPVSATPEADLTSVSDLRQPMIQQDEDGRRLVAPIALRDQVLGALVFRQDPDQPPWSEEETALAEELSTQIGLALEYARLLDETRRRADREQLLSEVTARMREVLDMDTVLRTAAREIEQRLGLYDVTIRLESENATD